MKFELLAGEHVQNNVKYKKGDIIDTDLNLVSMFRRKFKKVSVDEPIPTDTKPEILKPESLSGGNKPKEPEEAKKIIASSGDLGPEVTVSFLEAKGTEFRIHKVGEQYTIVDGKGNQISPFAREEVVIYLKSNAS